MVENEWMYEYYYNDLKVWYEVEYQIVFAIERNRLFVSNFDDLD